MKKLDILIDSLHTGGVEKIALNQVLHLNKIGKVSSLYVLRRTDLSNHPFQELISKVPLVFLDDRLPSLLKISFKFPYFSFFSLYHLTYPLFLPFVLKDNEFEGLLVHGTYTTFSAISFRILRGYEFFTSIWDPIAYIIRKAYTSGPIAFLQFILIPVGKLLDWLIIISARGILVAGKPHIPYLTGLGAKRVEIVYPGVDPRKELDTHKQKYILAVTAWKEGKHPEYNLDLIEKLPDMDLIMAGSWYPHELEVMFKETIREKGLEKRVKVTGSMEEKELQKLYSNALVFLQTNDDRGFGMPALEAASCGTTFIIPEGQGVCELFEDGVDGFYTKERATSDIIAKITLLAENPMTAVKMGKSAWEKVVDTYSWEKHSTKIFEIISA